MIRTFEELFEKMQTDGKKWIPLYTTYHDYLHWQNEMETTTGGPRDTARRIRDRNVRNLEGYLSCLRDMGYISGSEYGWLWGSLDSL